MRKRPGKMTDAELMTWNARHPEGSPCWLLLDDGNLLETKTRSQAWLLGNGEPVAKVEGKTGGWLLERVFFGTQEQAAAKIVDLLGLGVPKVWRSLPHALPLGTLEPQPNEMVMRMLRDSRTPDPARLMAHEALPERGPVVYVGDGEPKGDPDVVCPHCGWHDRAWSENWKASDPDVKHCACHACHKEFEARRHTVVTYTTTREGEA